MLVPATHSRSLSHSDLFVFSRGPAMLDSRFRLQWTSHEHKLHLCKATLTVCTPDLEFQISIGQAGFSEILIYVASIFLDLFINWFADCSHCNQEGPFPPRETCLISVIWCHLQQTLRVEKRVTKSVDVCGVPLLVALLGNCRSIGSIPQDPVLPLQTFRSL